MIENQMYCSGAGFPEMEWPSVAVCDGEDCHSTFMHSDLRDFRGKDYCPECYPKCESIGCENPQHEQGDEICAKCALEIAYENRTEHYQNKPFPMTQKWFDELTIIEVQVELWTARQ